MTKCCRQQYKESHDFNRGRMSTPFSFPPVDCIPETSSPFSLRKGASPQVGKFFAEGRASAGASSAEGQLQAFPFPPSHIFLFQCLRPRFSFFEEKNGSFSLSRLFFERKGRLFSFINRILGMVFLLILSQKQFLYHCLKAG